MSDNSTITIEGNRILSLSEFTNLQITGSSFVSVAAGSVVVSDFATIEISQDSILLNDDLLDLRGNTEIFLPEGNQFVVDDNGIVTVHQELNITSADTTLDSARIPNVENSGILDMRDSSGGNLYVPITNNQGGLVSMGSSKFSMVGLENSGGVFFSNSLIEVVDNSTTGDLSQPNKSPLRMARGSQSQGILTLSGDFVNDGSIMYDSSLGSLYEIGGNYESSDDATVYITILDTKHPGRGYSLVDVHNSADLGGTVEICIPSSANLGNTKKLDVFKFANLRNKFKHVKFTCSPQHNSASYEKHMIAKRSGKALEQVTQFEMMEEASSCTSSEYTSGSFAVLFEGCGQSKSVQYLYMWLFIGFIGGALICIFLAIVAYEIRPFRMLLVGGEGRRIEHVRKVQKQVRSSGSEPSGFSSDSSVCENL